MTVFEPHQCDSRRAVPAQGRRSDGSFGLWGVACGPGAAASWSRADRESPQPHAMAAPTTWDVGEARAALREGNPVTERRIVVIAFLAFLAVGSAVILVYAAQPTSHPSIQSGHGAATTRSHRATTSSTTPVALPQPPTEVEGESATSGTAKPASTTAPATTAPPTAAAPPSAELLTTVPPTMAPPDDGAADDGAADDRAADDRAAHHRAAQHRTAYHGSPDDEKDPARPGQEVSALGARNERAFRSPELSERGGS